MVSVIYKKRAIPIVWTVRKGKTGHLPESLLYQLIEKLVAIAPESCRKTMLGDGEFDGRHRMVILCRPSLKSIGGAT